MRVSKRQRRYGMTASKNIGEFFEENRHIYESPRWTDYKKANPLGNRRCERCGTKSNLQRHHKLSAIKYPSEIDNPHNIEILCRDCHNSEHKRRF